MIKGVGVDAVEIDRVQKYCEKEHFRKRMFTAGEIEQFDKRMIRPASDFAGKEAVAKTFGTGFNGCMPLDIEILRDVKGAPYVRLHGGAERLAKERGITRIQISISNTSNLAVAFAVASDDPEIQEERV